jgi:penicillin-binding protein 1A
MLDLLWEAANVGTGRRAAVRLPTFGKTGTSQDGRDALFVGFAGDLVCAVWIGRDDNKPISGASGGLLPAQVWRNFMSGLRLRPLDLPAPPRATRETRLWGAEDTPEQELEAPLITLPIDGEDLPPPDGPENGVPVIIPGVAPAPVGPPPGDEDEPDANEQELPEDTE